MQVAEVQKKNHLHLGDALVKLNSIKAEDLPKLLASTKPTRRPIPRGRRTRTPVPNEDLWLLYADRTYNMFKRVVQITFKPTSVRSLTGSNPTIRSLACT